MQTKIPWKKKHLSVSVTLPLLPVPEDFICKTDTVAAALEDVGAHSVEEICLVLENFVF